MDNPSFQNTTASAVQLFDSFSDAADPDSCYYGTLTPLATVQPGATADVTPVHSPICAVIAFDPAGQPVGRYVARRNHLSFQVTPADAAAIRHAGQFLDYRLANPAAPLVTQFDALVAQGDSQGVDTLFAQSADYPDCTFPAYMLALTDRAKTPPPPAQPPVPPEQQTYSLSALCRFLGGTWPSELPDIVVEDFSCSTANGALALAGTIDLGQMTFGSSGIVSNIESLLPLNKVRASLQVSTAIGPGLLGTRISFVTQDIHVPAGGGRTLTLARPTISLDLNPAFRFFVFKASAAMPFNVFGTTFEADISLVVDNVEAEVGVVVKGDTGSLPAPKPIKGVHFDSFGVGLGVIFEPPSCALGLEGSFHIGEGAGVALNDDGFVLVCGMEGEVPNPLYIAFTVPRLDFPTLVEVFTDHTAAVDLPVSFENLSFQWAEDPMEPLILPDGSLTQMAFGCSALAQVLDFGFYGLIDLSLGGVEAKLTCTPIVLGSLLTVTGQGTGVSFKVDENGTPLNNARLPRTAAARKVIDAAPTRQFVAPGGPELVVSTSSQPFFLLTGQVRLLDCFAAVDATLDKTGFLFELDFGGVLNGRMTCRLSSAGAFHGGFSFSTRGGPVIRLPVVNGFGLGLVTALSDVAATLDITQAGGLVRLTAAAGFGFAGQSLQAGPCELDVNVSTMAQLIDRLVDGIAADAGTVFGPVLNDATRWASTVRSGLIQATGRVATGLRLAYGRSINQAAQILNDAGYEVNGAADDIRQAFNPSAQEMASALQSGFQQSAEQVTATLKRMQYGITDTAAAIASVFQKAPAEVRTLLSQVGYADDQIKDAFMSLGGNFATSVKDIWGSVEEGIEGIGHRIFGGL